MNPSNGGKAPAKEIKESSLKSFLAKLRKRHIIETLAAFIGGGWLLVEVVERLLVGHYKFPEASIDLTVVSIIGVMLCTLIWRWFSGTEKRPGNVKVEVLLVPLIILVALAIDLNLILQIAGIPAEKLLIGIGAFLLGITWVIFKLSQWAAGMPETGKKEVVVLPSITARPEKSIVVLPFVNISPEEGQEYFCDGMTEEIITDLSHVHDLLVISRNSAMTFKGTQKKTQEIAREVNVHYVLEGSVRKAGNDLRITVQLIDATNDAHIWAEKYSGKLDDVFDIQEKVSRTIMQALRLKLSADEEHKMTARPIDDVRAYEYYLKAHAEVFKMSGEAITRAIEYLQNALDIMGDNALLYSGMAWAYWWLVNIGAGQEEHLVKAEEFAQKALTVNPESAQAHAMLGWIYLWSNMRQAVYHSKKALSINSDDTLALQGLAMVYVQLVGKVGAGIPLIEKLLQIDPLDFPTRMFQGLIYFYDGKYDLALPPLRRLYEELPENPAVQVFYALTKVSLGQMDEALSVLGETGTAMRSDAFSKLGRLLRYSILKDKDKVFQELTPDLQKTYLRDASFAHPLSGILAILGAKGEALIWLENAVGHGFINYPLLAEKDPLLANLRNEPRFKKLMERVKYEWEHFEE